MSESARFIVGRVCFIVAGLMIYFFPAWVARDRRKANLGAIFALNLLTGWTFIGWVVALVWALTNDRPEVLQ